MSPLHQVSVDPSISLQPHFPCGPCPVSEEVFTQITFYRVLLNNLQLSNIERLSPIEREHLDQKISIVQGMVEALWKIYHIAEDSLQEYRVGVEE